MTEQSAELMALVERLREQAELLREHAKKLRIGTSKLHRARYTMNSAADAMDEAIERLSRPPVQSPSGQVVGGEGLVEALDRLSLNLSCAPADAEKCFVSLDVRRTIHAALRSQPAPDDWRPIETAPKDGRGVLVICMGAEQPIAGAGWFIGGNWTTLDPRGAEGFDEDFFHSSTWFEPTHWRPLPDPPQPVEQGE